MVHSPIREGQIQKDQRIIFIIMVIPSSSLVTGEKPTSPFSLFLAFLISPSTSTPPASFLMKHALIIPQRSLFICTHLKLRKKGFDRFHIIADMGFALCIRKEYISPGSWKSCAGRCFYPREIRRGQPQLVDLMICQTFRATKTLHLHSRLLYLCAPCWGLYITDELRSSTIFTLATRCAFVISSIKKII